MRHRDKCYLVNKVDAERTMTAHMLALVDRSPTTLINNRNAIAQFLAFVSKSSRPGSTRLVIDEPLLLRWMTREAKLCKIRHAGQRLGILSRYLRALTQAGYLGTDSLALFKAQHGNRHWDQIVVALQGDNPAQTLKALHAAPPVAGPICADVQRYIELQQALGKSYRTNSAALLEFDAFLHTQGVLIPRAVTSQMVEQWIDRMTCSAYTRINKVRFVARFFDYLRSLAVLTENPATCALLCKSRQPPSSFRPFIFTKEQAAAILAEAQRLPRTKVFPLRSQTCYTMLALLYALGLRRGEVRHLRVRDLDFARQTLFINLTKFHKSRYVPFGPKVGLCLERYLAVRRTIQKPLQKDDLLFVTLRRTPVSGNTLLSTFHAILRTLNIAGIEGQGQPRLHDLRHNAASRIMPTRSAG